MGCGEGENLAENLLDALVHLLHPLVIPVPSMSNLIGTPKNS